MKDKCLIIAEAGVNHNGDIETAFKLCDSAKDAGADVIKFQTWITEKIITKNVSQAEYQKINTGREESQYDMLKRLELSFEAFTRIKEYCESIGIIFSSTADDEESLDFLIDLGIPFIKVGSGDIGNIPFLRYIGSKHKPVILSTGMSTLADIDYSIRSLKEGGAEDITLLHCTTSYPCECGDVNLNAMLTIRDAFKLPVGYSDHTIGTEVSVAAVALGARVIEKHFTIDKNMSGPDHLASTEPDAFWKMVKQIRNIEKALGDGIKTPTVNENAVRQVVTKRIVAKKPIIIGDVISQDNACVKRNSEGELAKEWDRVIGSKAVRNYSCDEGIELQ